MFRAVIDSFGSDEQKETYLGDQNIKGLFAQTEISNCCKTAQSIQTKATYDKSSDEFVIKIPNSAWCKNLGRSTVNHCVIFARLIVSNTDYGVHAFVVKLREISEAMRYDELIKQNIQSKLQQAA